MNLNRYFSVANQYKNNSQKIRIMTESWVKEYIYFPICGQNIDEYENNRPVADFYCSSCREDFELKSKKGNSLGKTIADGAYNTMINRITSVDSPHFFFLNYDKNSYDIVNFVTTPSYMFVPEMIIKRNKAIPNRPNYFMCNIDISSVPSSGKIFYIKDGIQQSKDKVLEEWHKLNFFKQSQNIKAKGWLIDIIRCIEKLNKNSFSLSDMYQFEKYLKLKHPDNNNIQAKIRQQLQVLRDKDYLNFESRGKYKLK